MTTEIKRGMRRKQRLYNKAKKEGTDSAWAKYRQKKHNIQKQVCQAHDEHVSHLLEGSLHTKNPTPFWRYIKSMKQDSTGISTLETLSVG